MSDTQWALMHYQRRGQNDAVTKPTTDGTGGGGQSLRKDGYRSEGLEKLRSVNSACHAEGVSHLIWDYARLASCFPGGKGQSKLW